MTELKPFSHQHFAHCESGVVTALLNHQGLPISEPMVFGLSGGLIFAYVPFVRLHGMPLVSYRMPPRCIIRGAAKRLQVPFRKKTYRSREAAREELDALLAAGRPVGLQTSVYWLPYFPPEMRFQFNAHNLIVFAREKDAYLVSDPVFEDIVRIAPEDLEKARFPRGILAPNGYLYYPDGAVPPPDLPSLIRHAVSRTARMMLGAPPPFGLRGYAVLARKIESLRHHPDARHVRHFLGNIVRMQEEIGTGGGGFRFMYAAFLQEAGRLTGSALLAEASERMTEAGDRLRLFALACARACKAKADAPDLMEIASRLRESARLERETFLPLRSLA